MMLLNKTLKKNFVSFVLGLIGTIFSSSLPVNALDAVVGDVVVADDKTSFFLRLDELPLYKNVFSLKNPNRIVVDVKKLNWKVKNKIQTKGIISSIRYGRNGDNGRVVIDINQPTNDFNLNVTSHPRLAGMYLLALDIFHSKNNNFSSKSTTQQVKSFGQTPQKFYSKHNFRTVKRNSAKDIIIIIDPGHGGQDPGATSVSGFKEKNIVLNFSKELANAINKQRNMHAILSRDSDFFIPLDERPLIADHYKADLFISVHADALANKNYGGSTVYTVSDTASDQVSAKIAESENRSDVVAGFRLQHDNPVVKDILFDFARRETDNHSYDFAEMLVKQIKSSTPMVANPHRKAGFRVLKSPYIPSVLVELGFLTNQNDETRLTNSVKRSNMVEDIVRAIKNWQIYKQSLNNE